MRRILLVLADRQTDTTAVEFGTQIAKLTSSGLTALFIRSQANELEETGQGKEPGKEKTEKATSTLALNKQKIDDSIDFFFKACARRGVSGDVLVRGKASHAGSSPTNEVVEESSFADLLIIDPEISFEIGNSLLSPGFVQNIAARAQCPILIAPASFTGLEQIVFCYDGSPSSLTAIKQFTYLLPELSTCKLTVVEIANSQDEVDKKEKLATWLRVHYRDFEFQLFHGNPTSELLKYFLSKDNAFVVLGSYGRSMVSRFFRRSSAELLMHVVNLPLFITHH